MCPLGRYEDIVGESELTMKECEGTLC